MRVIEARRGSWKIHGLNKDLSGLCCEPKQALCCLLLLIPIKPKSNVCEFING